MFITYFKTMLRHLRKNKTGGFLNIFGLAIGVACAGLIFLWVEDEMNYDKINVKKDRLYVIRENQLYDGNIRTFWSSPGLLGPAMQAEIPGIANTCRQSEGQSSLLFTIGDKQVYSGGVYAEPSLFSLFTIPFVNGNAKNPFPQRYSIVITERAAKKFFGGDKNVMGRTVRIDNKQDYVVSGLVKDLPSNSTFQFEWVAPFQVFYDQNDYTHKWGNNCLTTFVELQPSTNPATIDKQLYDFVHQKEPGSLVHPLLFSMNNWHLYDSFENGKLTGGGRIEYLRLFSVIAWIILLIACINFMNLATARSEKRAREVGVRKVLGAEKSGLVAQFIGESLFMSLLSVMVAVVLISLVLPAFNGLVQKELSLGLGNPTHLLSLVVITLVCGLIAGSYPSLYLSSFNPVSVLKGLKLKTGSAAFIRKGLVVLQFTISIVLIISTIIIYQQIQHVKSRNQGYNRDRLIQTDVVGGMDKQFAVIRQDLLSTGVVENAALSDHATIYGGNNTSDLTWAGKDLTNRTLISTRQVSPEFVAASGMHIVEGRDFQVTDTAKDQNAKTLNILITESLARQMGKGSAVSKKIFYLGDTSLRAIVVGVVKDFVYGDMYGRPDPVVFICANQGASVLYIRTKQGARTEQALAKISAVMKKDNPAYPFNYIFVDEQFNNMFQSEMLVGKLSRVFAALAIVISCLGLFGLAAYTAERRIKEIGIRKILGASVTTITTLLSKDFLQLIALSAIIAFPIAWWAMHNWLQGYQYRIDISWWVFALAGVLALFIALVTISFQSIRAALMNPVKSLRAE
jgi:putative ABC transport system permease protein